MKEMNELLEIATFLMGPKGCPWDREQTLESLQKHFLEEVYELIDAIDQKDQKNIIEELGDLLYVLIFAAKIGAKENKFSITEIILQQKEKLIRRHPHVFGEKKINHNLSLQELELQWEEIKEKENQKKGRTSIFDALPKKIPLIMRCQKFFYIIEKHPLFSVKDLLEEVQEPLIKEILDAIQKAPQDLENKVRQELFELEKKCRILEEKSLEKSQNN